MNGGGCLICGTALERSATGRPPVYCGKACKRASEYERRRLQGQLDVLERYLRNLRLLDTERRQQRRIQEEIKQAQARLLALLAG